MRPVGIKFMRVARSAPFFEERHFARPIRASVASARSTIPTRRPALAKAQTQWQPHMTPPPRTTDVKVDFRALPRPCALRSSPRSFGLIPGKVSRG